MEFVASILASDAITGELAMLIRWGVLSGLACGLVLGALGPVPLRASDQGTGNCRVGLTVKTRDGKTGQVKSADGASCWVHFPDGTKSYMLQWMLTPVGSAGATSGKPSSQSAGSASTAVQPGNYQCYGGAAGNMRITLTGKRWNEFYAQRLPDGRVGISSKPNGKPYYMLCERR